MTIQEIGNEIHLHMTFFVLTNPQSTYLLHELNEKVPVIDCDRDLDVPTFRSAPPILHEQRIRLPASCLLNEVYPGYY